MRIGLVSEYYPPFAPGGAEWSTERLARALAAAHDVVVVTPNYGAPPLEREGRLTVRRFPFPYRLRAGQRTLPYRYHANPLFYLWTALWVGRIARHARVDVLHVQNKYALPGAWLAARLLRIPVLFTLRDTFQICPLGRCLLEYDHVPPGCGRGTLWRQDVEHHIAHYVRPRGAMGRLRTRLVLEWLRLDTRLRRAVLARADGVVAVSQGILRLHQEAGVRLGHQARAIYNLPPSTDAPSPQALGALRGDLSLGEGPVVLFVGRLSPGKGAADLLEAAPQIAEAIPGVQVLLVGPGEPLPAWTHSCVRHLGALPHAQVLALYHLAAVVVVPSVWPEPLSRVLLEALAAGRPVVGTATGGTPELVADGENGYLVPRRAPRALAEAVVRIVGNPALAARMGAASRRLLAERFDPAQSVAQTVAFYRALMGGQGAAE